MTGTQLPLFRRIVFVDWHGVLSNERFWSSILSAPKHPLKPRLNEAVSQIFSRNDDLEHWMRGDLKSVDIIKQMGISERGRYGQEFVERRLMADCASMRVDQELFRLLAEVRSIAPVVLATDNMDCFSTAFNAAIAARRRRKEGDPPSLRQWAQVSDGIICSSDVGVLKSEDPKAFFGATLERYGFDFRNAVLIDDREDNCCAFRNVGGEAITFKTGRDSVQLLASKLGAWLGWSPAGLRT